MNDEEQTPTDMKQYYLLGVIVLVAIVIGAFMLRPKSSMVSTTTEPGVPTPTPGPITKLACESQYYNPKIAFAEYYLSVDGVDVSEAKSVSCVMTASVNDEVKATQTVTSPLTAAPQRGGSTFRCTTRAIALDPDIPTKIDVVLTDDLKASSTCSATFVLPAP